MMYFYSQQTRRFLNQIIAVLSNFQVEWGSDNNGNKQYYRVPVTYATSDKMVASILKENSENKMLSVPAISVYITELNYDRERMQNPTFVERTNLRLPRVNQVSGKTIHHQPGNSFSIEKLMPVPYNLTVNADIWTSSIDQKLQILEQLAVLFNPDFEIQSTDNYQDWGSLSRMILDNVTYTSRAQPLGSDDSIETATMTFTCPIWLSPPAKLKKMGVIETIVSSVYNAQGDMNPVITDSLEKLGRRQYITPTGYNLIMLNGEARLYPSGGPLNQGDLNTNPTSGSDPIEWAPYIAQMGSVKNGITQLRLRDTSNTPSITEIVGTVSLHPNNPYVLLVNVDEDTLPTNSLPAVDAIIDPLRTAPGVNGFPPAARGDRYLILNPINSGVTDTSYDGADAWKSSVGRDFFADTSDIIEYDGAQWIVSWDASDSNRKEYVTNITTKLQYKWEGKLWVHSWQGEYSAGEWAVVF